MRETLEHAEEVWLSPAELCKQFQMFSPSWLKRYGMKLPRTKAIVRDSDGTTHETGWAYPRNRIQRMIAEGQIKTL